MGKIKNLGIMSCILIIYPYDKHLEMIQALVQELYHLLVLAPWWPNQESDWTEIWSELLLPSGTYVQFFRWIAPAVNTKRALLTDDDDGRHVGSP
jgi:hypothetical protein